MKGTIIHIKFDDCRLPCPECDTMHDSEEYRERLNRAKQGWVTVTCKGCKYKFGHAVDITGKVVAFVID